MPSSDEVKGMQDILDKLNTVSEVAEQKAKSSDSKSIIPGNVSSNAKEMYNILHKLEEATKKAADKVISEAENDTSVLAAVATKENNNISINGDYNIELVQKYVIDGVKKKYYNIKDSEGNVIYEDIALFESAMGIVKNLMFEKSHKVDEIARLDERYASYLTEAAIYKQRSQTAKDVYRVDVAVAKQGNAVQKMGSIKKQIKTLL